MRTKPNDEPGWEMIPGVDAFQAWGLKRPGYQCHRDGRWCRVTILNTEVGDTYANTLWYRRPVEVNVVELEHFI